MDDGRLPMTPEEYESLRSLFPAARQRLTRPGAYEIPSVEIALAIARRAASREDAA